MLKFLKFTFLALLTAIAVSGSAPAANKINPITLNDAQRAAVVRVNDFINSFTTLRGDYTKPDGTIDNRLRMWEKFDFMPQPDDLLQERLYCIQWARPKKRGNGIEYEFRTATEDDLWAAGQARVLHHRAHGGVQDGLAGANLASDANTPRRTGRALPAHHIVWEAAGAHRRRRHSLNVPRTPWGAISTTTSSTAP